MFTSVANRLYDESTLSNSPLSFVGLIYRYFNDFSGRAIV
jgi:hypothetical protein